MRLDILAHPDLVEQVADPASCQLLLESDWPAPEGAPVRRLALDDAVDGRWQWIDDEANRLAARIPECLHISPPSIAGLRGDWLCSLALRYYLVRLLRVTAYLDRFLEVESPTCIRLFADSQRDADYAHIIGQLCRMRAIRLEKHAGESLSTSARLQLPRAHADRLSRLRARFSGLHRRWDQGDPGRMVDRRARVAPNDRVRRQAPVVLCGHPSFFDPLCESLLHRGGVPVYLLAERFAFRWFARWRWRGVRMLDCGDGEPRGADATAHRGNNASCDRNVGAARSPLRFRGVDLTAPLADWLRNRSELLGERLDKAVGRLDEHFDRIHPGWLLVDEDATPFKRAAVTVARKRGIATAVVQHGAPYVPFGFAPLVAHYLFAWGESSRRQLQRWGVPDSSLVVTGCPKHDAWFASTAAASPQRAIGNGNHEHRRLLLLATVHHAPERPDLVGFHLTARTNAAMVRWALEAVERRPGWMLTIKLHPRTPDAAFFGHLVDSLPAVRNRVQLLEKGDVLTLARRADCVLSCASSSGIEAMIAGRPVIQLMPSGSVDLIRADEWGFAGTARRGDELDQLLSRLDQLDRPGAAQLDRNFGNRYTPATGQIIDFLTRGSDRTRGAGAHRPRVSRSMRPSSRSA